MSDQPQRKPTPAVYRVSPLYEVYGETLYPYINLKQNGVTPFLTSFKRAISALNPFALQQVPTTDSIAFGPKYGERFWLPEPYPTRIVRQNGSVTHYDPFKNPRYQKPPNGSPLSYTPGVRVSFYPKHCTRSVHAYKVCLIANDRDEKVCKQKGEDILAICPPWALDKMRQNRKLFTKLQGQQNKRFYQAMTLGPYNQNRTLADTTRREWIEGQRIYLRENSMWADKRYADITQQQIDEAKERVKKRAAQRGIKPNDQIHIQNYDRRYEAPSTSIPLYP